MRIRRDGKLRRKRRKSARRLRSGQKRKKRRSGRRWRRRGGKGRRVWSMPSGQRRRTRRKKKKGRRRRSGVVRRTRALTLWLGMIQTEALSPPLRRARRKANRRTQPMQATKRTATNPLLVSRNPRRDFSNSQPSPRGLTCQLLPRTMRRSHPCLINPLCHCQLLCVLLPHLETAAVVEVRRIWLSRCKARQSLARARDSR